MGQIILGDKGISNVILGDAQVASIWLGNVLVWPTDYYDCPDKLLHERGYGFKAYVGNEPHADGEKIITIDRKTYPKDYSDLYTILTDGHQLGDTAYEAAPVEYESINDYPHITTFVREIADRHYDRDANFVSDETYNTVLKEHDSFDMPEDSPVGIAFDKFPVIGGAEPMIEDPDEE